jgi:hypothetical protein
MGLEMRRRNIEKSDLESFSENKWNKRDSTTRNITSEDLKSIKDLLNSMEGPLFSEQEAGKATIYTELERKEDAKSFEDMSLEEIEKGMDAFFSDRS